MTLTSLDSLLTILHDRGVLNEEALRHVCGDLFEGKVLTREHLIAIFGINPVYRLVTMKDETARQLVREAVDILTNPESRVDLRDWVRAAESIVGPKETT